MRCRENQGRIVTQAIKQRQWNLRLLALGLHVKSGVMRSEIEGPRML